VADVTPTPTLVAPGFAPPPVSRPASPPAVAAIPPGAPPTAPSRVQRSSLRVEVIVYSDERAKRLAFINGRKFVEGDALGDGLRLEEIQPNAVVINEDGRRVTLRP
jgi:type II secretion system (T2SS) protein B